MADAAELVTARLRERLRPARLEVEDLSDEHLGHAEAGRGAHLRLRISAAGFAGLSELERHRLVYNCLGDLEKLGVHALAITALSD
ncbi:MAG: BolA family transcriptional regulator [Betaproteobacteria bacterium AqS2]|uniref:BolA family transcriptional regulator n=1 Tax=Candidatus Amphirhobacter heronislandensis TaxID=1732024 RepID=A0A930XXT8_9GAMM|nr:BolA family transcriptional regulator [Betaproteobacteria bacterium AqS2]